MDSITTKTILQAGEELFHAALKASPSNDGGYGLALGVLVLVAIYNGVTTHLERRDSKRYRSQQDDKAEKREAAASKRAIAEQDSRHAARDRVIEEQRLHRDELKKSFGSVVEPLDSRIGDLERRERQHAESIILLKFKFGIHPPKEGE